MIKPQGSFLIVPYLLWLEREDISQLVRTIATGIAFTLPISLMGSPPLLLQWIDNIRTPSSANQGYWSANNISMSNLLGVYTSIVVISLSLIALYFLMRFLGKKWTHNHMIAALLMASMLLSPYTSTQSVIAALAFVPSWIATLSQYIITGITGALGIYIRWASIWMLIFGLIALFFMPTKSEQADATKTETL